MPEIELTVVIPTYNRPSLLMRALRSVLDQSFSRLKVMIVVDGIDAATTDILSGIDDPRVTVIPLPFSVGGAEARNVGVRNALTKWIAFLDDDDEWLPQKIEKQLQLAASLDARYPVICTKVIGKSPHGEFHWPRRYPEPSEQICEYLFNRSTPFRGDTQLQTSMLLVLRELLLLVPFTKGLRRHQDTEWYLRVAQVPGVEFHFVKELLVKWYVEENRNAITNRNDWKASLSWLRDNKSRMTSRAYAGFVATQLSGEAVVEVGWRAFPTLLKELIYEGKPRLMDLIIFACMWLSTQGTRRRIRSALRARTPRTASRPA